MLKIEMRKLLERPRHGLMGIMKIGFKQNE
jgi:hypothetical protein